VLIGRGTASSAEVLLAALAGRERVRTFGSPTRGVSAGNRTFDLADGAALVLTVAATSDRAGRLYVGPIPPDVPVAAAAASAAADDPVLAAAAAWHGAAPPCE
jgi:carboxyl-terminal processing protease